jgi:hypothetical protein
MNHETPTLEALHLQVLSLRAEMEALGLIVQETICLLVAQDVRPTLAFALTRQNIEQRQEAAERLATRQCYGVHPIQAAHFARVSAVLKRTLDGVEELVTALKCDSSVG